MKTFLHYSLWVFYTLLYSLSPAQTWIVEGAVVRYKSGFNTYSSSPLPGIQLKANWEWFPTQTDHNGFFRMYALDVSPDVEARIKLESDSLHVVNSQDLNAIRLDKDEFLIVYLASEEDLELARIELFESEIDSFFAWRELVQVELKGTSLRREEAIETLEHRWHRDISDPEQALKLLDKETNAVVNLLPKMAQRFQGFDMEKASALCLEAHKLLEKGNFSPAMDALASLQEYKNGYRLALRKQEKQRQDKAKEVEKLQSSITMNLLGVQGARGMNDQELAVQFLHQAVQSLRKLENPMQDCSPPLPFRITEDTQVDLLIDAYIRRAEAFHDQKEFVRAALDLETVARLLLKQ